MTKTEAAIRRLAGCGAVRAAGILLALSAVLFGQVTINEFGIPTAASGPLVITKGPDGNLWFTEYNGNKIGRITTGGSITDFAIPTASSSPFAITSGPDGNLWFAETSGNKIGRITTGGAVTEFAVPTASSVPSGITSGQDGNLWFTEGFGNQIGRLVLASAPAPAPAAVPTLSGWSLALCGILLLCIAAWTFLPRHRLM